MLSPTPAHPSRLCDCQAGCRLFPAVGGIARSVTEKLQRLPRGRTRGGYGQPVTVRHVRTDSPRTCSKAHRYLPSSGVARPMAGWQRRRSILALRHVIAGTPSPLVRLHISVTPPAEALHAQRAGGGGLSSAAARPRCRALADLSARYTRRTGESYRGTDGRSIDGTNKVTLNERPCRRDRQAERAGPIIETRPSEADAARAQRTR